MRLLNVHCKASESLTGGIYGLNIRWAEQEEKKERCAAQLYHNYQSSLLIHCGREIIDNNVLLVVDAVALFFN